MVGEGILISPYLGFLNFFLLLFICKEIKPTQK